MEEVKYPKLYYLLIPMKATLCLILIYHRGPSFISRILRHTSSYYIRQVVWNQVHYATKFEKTGIIYFIENFFFIIFHIMGSYTECLEPRSVGYSNWSMQFLSRKLQNPSLPLRSCRPADMIIFLIAQSIIMTFNAFLSFCLFGQTYAQPHLHLHAYHLPISNYIMHYIPSFT